MYPERTLRVVVLPEPVPPEMMVLSLDLTQISRNSAISGVRVPKPIKSSTVYGTLENRRMVITGPWRARGGMMTFTRDPSGRRAST